MANYYSPKEIIDYTSEGGLGKVNRSPLVVFLMAIMAGVYIALGGFASSVGSHGIADAGLAKVVAGTIFPIGLMCVVIIGADLFTGNCLIVVTCLDKKAKLAQFATNLIIVFLGNLVGSLLISFIVANAGMAGFNGGKLGEYFVKSASKKVNLGFKQALCMGIICNLFVCAGVLLMYAAHDISGKVLAGFFAIFAFVVSGTEHVVANMFYVPVALFMKTPELLEAAHVDAASLTWSKFFINNVIPVTIGNIIGGTFLGIMYYLIHRQFAKK